ncbi:MAG: flagellar biosynthesis protein FlhB [Nitrospirae bacterium]|nr:flagellar biosynthesis protein FlhB [Nitrospirota bacterium]
MPIFGRDPSKTEAPTAKRRSEAQSQGQVARSKEISNVVVLFASLLALYWFGSKMFEGLGAFMGQTFSHLHQPDFTLQGFYSYAIGIATISAKIIAPILIVLLIAGVLGNIAQVGFIFSTESLTPNLAKLNPLMGLQRLISLNGFVELAKSSVKLVVVGAVAYLVVKKELKLIPYITDMSVPAIAAYILKVATKLFIYIGLIMVVIAILDYAYQKWEHEQSLKMTKEEVKDEFKQREGDPQVKSKMRQKQREAAMKRMMQEVPKADVVITNPIFLAVAIKYDSGSMTAPVVVAKGARLIAERIRDLAKANGVPIWVDQYLARELYDRVDIGGQIPVEVFAAVAQVLAHIYRMKNKAA